MSSYQSDAIGLWGGEGEDIIKRDFPIHRACRDGDLDTLRRLRALATRDHLVAEDKFYGWTPIHWAAYFGKIDCLNELLSYGVPSNICTTKFKQTPCHIASFGGHPKCLVRLLKAGANFHAQDYLGETPIHKAARVGNIESIRILLSTGSRVNLCNINGHTPSDLARMQGYLECAKSMEAPGYASQQCVGLSTGNSGIFMNGNHLNGAGANGKDNSRKRLYADESMPIHKRSKLEVTASHQQNGHINGNGLSHGHTNGNGLPANVCEDFDDCMDTEASVNSVTVQQTADNTHQEDYQRAPSPGMDINLDCDSDMQYWGHQNGYGDTAETMPSPKCKQNLNGYGRSSCVAFRGLQSRGWN